MQSFMIFFQYIYISMPSGNGIVWKNIYTVSTVWHRIFSSYGILDVILQLDASFGVGRNYTLSIVLKC